MPLGRTTEGRRTVSLEDGATPGGARCPACDAPLFVWVETTGFGPREDQVVDRCENCGLVVGRDFVPDADAAVQELLSMGDGGGGPIRTPNADSFQAWLDADNWAALRPGRAGLVPSARSAKLLLSKGGMTVRSIRYLPAAGIASMWQTLLNLLTFHHNFASEAASGRLRPAPGRGRLAYAIDAVVTVLAAIPVAFLAAVFEGGAVLARRGGMMEVKTGPADASDPRGQAPAGNHT